jgi:phosphoribosylglycinamide formyltransferase 1
MCPILQGGGAAVVVERSGRPWTVEEYLWLERNSLVKHEYLASHGGSSMTALLDAIHRGQLDASAQVVISNNSRAAGLATARGAGIPSYHLSETTVGSSNGLDVAIRDALVRYDVNLVILSGYMQKIGPKTLDAFRGRILNVHPALLPKYGGHGM